MKYNFRITGTRPNTKKVFYAYRSLNAASYKEAIDLLKYEFPEGTKFINIDLIEENKNGH